MNNRDLKFKAFDFASETTKQLITIATGIIALMVTFSKDVVGQSVASEKTLLLWTWGIFITSIIFGILTLMALTGTLQPKANNQSTEQNQEQEQQENNVPKTEIDLNINNFNIRLFSGLQLLFFIIGLCLTAWFGYKSLNSNENEKIKDVKNQFKIIRKSYLNNDSTTVYYDTIYIDKNNCH